MLPSLSPTSIIELDAHFLSEKKKTDRNKEKKRKKNERGRGEKEKGRKKRKGREGRKGKQNKEKGRKGRRKYKNCLIGDRLPYITVKSIHCQIYFV